LQGNVDGQPVVVNYAVFAILKLAGLNSRYRPPPLLNGQDMRALVVSLNWVDSSTIGSRDSTFGGGSNRRGAVRKTRAVHELAIGPDNIDPADEKAVL